MLLDENHGGELKLQRLWAGGKRRLGVTNSPGVSRMCQGYVRLMLPRAWVLKEPLTQTVELTQTLLTWQEHSMAAEVPRLTERQEKWAARPLFHPAEDARVIHMRDLVFAADRDVSGDE